MVTSAGISRTVLLSVALASLAFPLTACASGGAGPESRRDQRALMADELQASGYQDAFSAVQALRPQWLWTRGTTSINQAETVKVYLDGSLMGGVDQLRQIPVRSIASIRHLDGLEATNRWGLDHGLGAILVSTRNDGR